MRSDPIPEDIEFGRNAAASSKDSFFAWMVERLEQLRGRFGWTDEETAAIAEVVMEARDNAITDLAAAAADIEKLADRKD